MTEPLPCPFCGNIPTLRDRRGTWAVVCSEPCPVFPAVTATADTREGAIRSWNTRAPDPREATLWQAIDDALTATPEERWKALERIESAAYVLRTR